MLETSCPCGTITCIANSLNKTRDNLHQFPSRSRLSVRDARPADYKAVSDILNENLHVNWRSSPITEDEVANWDDPLSAEGKTEFLVATNYSKSVVGFITARQTHPDSGFKTSQSISIYTTKDNHEKGVGSVLLSNLVDRLQEKSVRTLVAFIDSNNSKSLLWHNNRGFALGGHLRRVGDRNGQERDLMLMVRQIDQASGA